MSRNDRTYYEVDWDEFCRIVIERWQKKMLEKGIYDTGTLYRSIEYGVRGVNAVNQSLGRGMGKTGMVTVPDVITFSFPLYGIYVERGVGRGYTRGNGGHLVTFEGRGRGRKKRTWYYRIFANERHRLGELVAQAYGNAARSMIHTLELHSIGTPRSAWK